jgi:hypothetical protein
VTRVVVAQRRGLSQAPVEHEIAWPAHWRLPVAGESIHVSREFGGFIEYVDWLVDERTVKINIR